MNKSIKKKRKLLDLAARLQRANNLQQETIEDYGRQLGDLKRRVVELEKVGGCNVLACNNRFDQLEAENKALRIDLDNAVFEFKKPKRSLFSRK